MSSPDDNAVSTGTEGTPKASTSCFEEQESKESSNIDDLLDDALNDFGPAKAHPSTSEGDTRRAEAFSDNSAGNRAKQKFDPLRRNTKADSKGKKFDPLSKGARKAQTSKESDAGLRVGNFGAVPPDVTDMNDELSKGLEQLMKELAQVDLQQEQGDLRPEAQFADTLRALSESQAVLRGSNSNTGATEPTASAAFSDSLFAGLQSSGEDGQDGIGSFADGIMRQLLSKEVLHQPMKDIAERYPAWLAAHRESLPGDEVARYEEQYQHIQAILHIYENDSDNYGELFGALQQMQACGQPPQDIVNDLAPGMSFDEDGLPKLPATGANPSGCCIQ